MRVQCALAIDSFLIFVILCCVLFVLQMLNPLTGNLCIALSTIEFQFSRLC